MSHIDWLRDQCLCMNSNHWTVVVVRIQDREKLHDFEFVQPQPAHKGTPPLLR